MFRKLYDEFANDDPYLIISDLKKTVQSIVNVSYDK